jgi:hypothetical protein
LGAAAIPSLVIIHLTVNFLIHASRSLTLRYCNALFQQLDELHQ